MIEILLHTQNFELKPNRKTAYQLTSEETKQIDELTYSRIVDSAKFFNRIGSCRQTKGYTCYGYKVIKDIATSPDKQYKTIRSFEFKYINNKL
jgi:hypothetical protein